MLQVKGLLDKEEVLFAKNKGYLYGTHVVVGLPECLAEASKEPHAVAIMQHTVAVAVDEVDACFLVSQSQTTPGVLQAVYSPELQHFNPLLSTLDIKSKIQVSCLHCRWSCLAASSCSTWCHSPVVHVRELHCSLWSACLQDCIWVSLPLHFAQHPANDD